MASMGRNPDPAIGMSRIINLQRQPFGIGTIGGSRQLMRAIHIGRLEAQVLAAEEIPNLLRSQLFTGDICGSLNDLAELDLQTARHHQLEVAL